MLHEIYFIEAKKIENLKEEIKTVKKNQMQILQLKNTETKLKIILSRLKSWLKH